MLKVYNRHNMLTVLVDFAFRKAVEYTVEEVLRSQAPPGLNRKALAAEIVRKLVAKINNAGA